MTSSNGRNIFRVTGPLCGEFTGHWWIPLTKASDVELRCFLWSALEQTVICDAIAPIMRSLWWDHSHIWKATRCYLFTASPRTWISVTAEDFNIGYIQVVLKVNSPYWERFYQRVCTAVSITKMWIQNPIDSPAAYCADFDTGLPTWTSAKRAFCTKRKQTLYGMLNH